MIQRPLSVYIKSVHANSPYEVVHYAEGFSDASLIKYPTFFQQYSTVEKTKEVIIKKAIAAEKKFCLNQKINVLFYTLLGLVFFGLALFFKSEVLGLASFIHFYLSVPYILNAWIHEDSNNRSS